MTDTIITDDLSGPRSTTGAPQSQSRSSTVNAARATSTTLRTAPSPSTDTNTTFAPVRPRTFKSRSARVHVALAVGYAGILAIDAALTAGIGHYGHAAILAAAAFIVAAGARLGGRISTQVTPDGLILTSFVRRRRAAYDQITAMNPAHGRTGIWQVRLTDGTRLTLPGVSDRETAHDLTNATAGHMPTPTLTSA